MNFLPCPLSDTPTGMGGDGFKKSRAHVCSRGTKFQAANLEPFVRMHGQRLTWT